MEVGEGVGFDFWVVFGEIEILFIVIRKIIRLLVLGYSRY